LTKHGISSDNRIIETASDAIRCLSCVASNRTRLGDAGACEALARALIKVSCHPSVEPPCPMICKFHTQPFISLTLPHVSPSTSPPCRRTRSQSWRAG
jgi:hypothetical protein